MRFLVNLGTANETGVGKRDRLIRVFLEQRLDVRPVRLSGDRDGVDAASSEGDDFGGTCSMHPSHQDAGFGDDRLATAQRRRTLGEQLARSRVIGVVLGQQGNERPGIQQDSGGVHSPSTASTPRVRFALLRQAWRECRPSSRGPVAHESHSVRQLVEMALGAEHLRREARARVMVPAE